MNIAFRETVGFTRKLAKIATDEEYQEVQNQLIEDPDCGDEISGTGGACILRMAIKGGGKSGGARVIYYYRSQANVIYMLDIYAKSEKASLTRGEKNDLAKFINEIEGGPNE